MLRVDEEAKSGSWEANQEATAIIQVREESGLDQGGSREGGESGQILEIF